MLPLSAKSQTLFLSNTAQNIIISDIYAPFSLTLDPRQVKFYEKIRAIEYVWGDGTSDMVSYQPSVSYDETLPFPSEIGNPLNYPKTKQYYSNDLKLSIYDIAINFYCFSNTNPYIFTITLNLKNPDIDYTDNSFFSDVHLVKTKMYGPKDTMLYTFQSQNDEYLLMSNVDWKLKPVLPPTIQQLSRPYRFLKPFETNSKVNSGIKTFDYDTNLPVNPDIDIAPIKFIPPTPTPSITPTISVTPTQTSTQTPTNTPTVTPTPTYDPR
jgi:hypothetical protein